MKFRIRAIGLLVALAIAVPSASFAQDNLINNLPARCVGPTSMAGRVTDLAVYEAEPRIFYVASASGGLWKTSNAGMTFKPVFDRENTVSLGAAAVGWNDPNLVWVGTGEATSRNSCSWGDGVYKSSDGGQSWTNMGLKETGHISRILIHPKDPNTVYVAALGHLWGYNVDRGVYKTTDGGKTWTLVLRIDAKTGISDLIMDPNNPNVLIAGGWERLRFAYDFISGGANSGIFKTTDGGKTWKQMTKGLPEGPLGRIGLNFFRKDPNVVIASIEAKGGGGVYRSKDKGESWEKLNSLNPRPFYFSMPRQDPTDIDRIYMPAVSFHYSTDGGKTFRVMDTRVHVDHHAMWINPKDNNHMIIGQDGGCAQTRDRGETWEHFNNMPIGQFYAVGYDMRKPYWVYGGLQDNGSWGVPTQHNRGSANFTDDNEVGQGDGFYVQVDPNDWRTLYCESQGGALVRVDLWAGGTRSIRPRENSVTPAEPSGSRFRFNWNTPFLISPHNSKTIYVGGNKLFKSVNRGDNWRVISPDLSTNNPLKLSPGRKSVSPEDTGAERHCTIVAVAESPMKQGLLWAGTDDGKAWVTQDDGANWTEVTANIPDLPANTWCSRLTPSRFVEGRCYATFDGHRSNDFKSYVYVTEDFGKTWSKLNKGIPDGDCCYVIREGLRNSDLLYLGTEMSLWISLDRGQSWARYRGSNFPTVAVHDVTLHPRENDLIIGTHGRSIWVMSTAALEDLTQEKLKDDLVMTKPSTVYLMPRRTGNSGDGVRLWTSPNTQPSATIAYYVKTAASGDARITVTDVAGNEITSMNGTSSAGLNVVTWNVRGGRGFGIRPGEYKVTVKVGEKTASTTVTIEDLGASGGDTTGRTTDTPDDVEP